MNLEEKSKIYKWGILASLAVFSIFLFYLNILFPYLPGDDYIFQLKIPEDGIIGSERINSLKDLFESQVNFYNNYHYRVINHTVLQVLLLLPPWIFDILNTVIFFLLPWVILKVDPSNNRNQYLSRYCLLLFFIWTFHFSLGWSYFPATGALNYTWMLIPQLWYIALLFEYREGDSAKVYPLFILAFLNCMANENVCLTLLAFTLLIAFDTRDRKNKALWICAAIIILGGIFMLSSPSIAKRLATQGHREAGALSHMVEYFKRTSYYLFRYSPAFILLFLFKGQIKNLRYKQWMLISGIGLSTLVMAIVPLYEARSAVFPFFLLLLFVVSLFNEVEVKKGFVIAMISLGIAVSIIRYPQFKTQQKRNHINLEILQSNQGQDEIQLQKYCDASQRGYILCHEISSNPKYIDNQTLSKFYNISEVRLSDIYIDSIRSVDIFRNLKHDANVLTSYKSLELSERQSLYYKRVDGGIEILAESNQLVNPFYIFRGHRKGITSHLFHGILPKGLRLFFLDYLEDTTQQSQASTIINEKHYAYSFIPLANNYKYILVSEYDFEKHSPVGEVVKLEF